MTDANDDVFKMKKWRFQTIPLWTFPKQQESPVLRQEGTRAREEDEEQGGKVEKQEEKAENNVKKWSMLFFITINNCKNNFRLDINNIHTKWIKQSGRQGPPPPPPKGELKENKLKIKS